MSETRKNHLSIDGGQVKDDEHVSSYKPIPESDTVPDFRTSKSSLAKSKEKISPDGAEEKLLAKEKEARITTRVDMADAKYVVGDHRNGDAKIELDANKRQFTGLTKEELMQYADDPFWVRLRWFMFVLFWALWLCMLAGAIAIIVRAPKCYPPPTRTWYEKGPLVDMSSVEDYSVVEESLPLLQSSKVAGIFAFSCKDAYEVLEDTTCIDKFKGLVLKAKSYGVKVIVDLTANFVSTTHVWFQKSVNKSSEYNDYFTWQPVKEYDENDPKEPKKPNNWVSTLNAPAWSLNEKRGEFYLHQFREDQPDLNMANPEVVKHFDEVLKKWMQAGAAGVRLHHARELLVNASLQDELGSKADSARGAVHTQRAFWQQRHTSDQPGLDALLAHWAHLVDGAGDPPALKETVFTLAEEAGRSELFHTALRPPSVAPLYVRNAKDAADALDKRLANWPALQLKSEDPGDQELASFALLLPASPVLDVLQLGRPVNDTVDKSFVDLVEQRSDASLEHGAWQVASVPARNSSDELLACIRWKAGHTGYVAVYNPLLVEARANLTGLSLLPDQLSVNRISQDVQMQTNYTKNTAVRSDDVLVPPSSTIVLLYVPKNAVEN